MKLFASSPSRPADGQGGFTLTEMIAALAVASLLVVGVAELTHRYARGYVQLRSDQTDMRADRLAAMLLHDLVRADPETLIVSRDEISAQIGAEEIKGRIRRTGDRAVLEWTSASQRRALNLPREAHFVKEGVLVRLEAGPGAPLATVRLERDAPYNCQFDTVSRACR